MSVCLSVRALACVAVYGARTHRVKVPGLSLSSQPMTVIQRARTRKTTPRQTQFQRSAWLITLTTTGGGGVLRSTRRPWNSCRWRVLLQSLQLNWARRRESLRNMLACGMRMRPRTTAVIAQTQTQTAMQITRNMSELMSLLRPSSCCLLPAGRCSP